MEVENEQLRQANLMLFEAVEKAVNAQSGTLTEARVGQACTWPVSSKGRDLKRGEWNGSSKTSLAQCEAKAESAGVSYFAWTKKVYGGYCKVLKSSVSSPNLSTYQGYKYKLYEKQCPEDICEDKNDQLAEIIVDGYTCAMALDDYGSDICSNELFKPYCCGTCAMQDICEDKNDELAEIIVDGYTCAMALDDYGSDICSNELFKPYCCGTCAMQALTEARVGQACTWPVSSNGRDLKRGEWKGSSKTSLAQCEAKAESAGVSYFAWTKKVYGGYCKVLKSSVSSPDLSTYQGYNYKLYEKQCSEAVPKCTPREMGGNTGRPAYKVQPAGNTACPDNHLQVTSHISCEDFIQALCLQKGSAWEPDRENAVCLMNGNSVEFYDIGGLEMPQIVCVEAFASISLPPGYGSLESAVAEEKESEVGGRKKRKKRASSKEDCKNPPQTKCELCEGVKDYCSGRRFVRTTYPLEDVQYSALFGCSYPETYEYVDSCDAMNSECSPVRCRMFCQNGYVKDENGCDTCQCASPRLMKTVSEEQALGMNRNELAGSIASKAGMTIEQARNTLQATVDIITDTVAKGDTGKVIIEGFGAFQRRERKAREGRNPLTGEKMIIPATKVPEFSPGNLFKEAVSGGSLELAYESESAVAREQAVGMNRNGLADSIASKAHITIEQARNALQAFVETIIDAVAKGDKVEIEGFGSFESRVRKAREMRNPKTGKKMEIPETTVPVFSAGKAFKEAVSGKSSRMSMSNEVIEATGAKWLVLMFALIGFFTMIFEGAKVIHKRACSSSEFQKILDDPKC